MEHKQSVPSHPSRTMSVTAPSSLWDYVLAARRILTEVVLYVRFAFCFPLSAILTLPNQHQPILYILDVSGRRRDVSQIFTFPNQTHIEIMSSELPDGVGVPIRRIESVHVCSLNHVPEDEIWSIRVWIALRVLRPVAEEKAVPPEAIDALARLFARTATLDGINNAVTKREVDSKDLGMVTRYP